MRTSKPFRWRHLDFVLGRYLRSIVKLVRNAERVADKQAVETAADTFRALKITIGHVAPRCICLMRAVVGVACRRSARCSGHGHPPMLFWRGFRLVRFVERRL